MPAIPLSARARLWLLWVTWCEAQTSTAYRRSYGGGLSPGPARASESGFFESGQGRPKGSRGDAGRTVSRLLVITTTEIRLESAAGSAEWLAAGVRHFADRARRSEPGSRRPSQYRFPPRESAHRLPPPDGDEGSLPGGEGQS